ncbi:MAG: MFS transporter [Chloroflexota bacterium]
MNVSDGSKPRGGFGRLWAAGAISNLGDGMLLAAIPLLVSTLTREPLLVAGATVAGQLPWLLLALPAGALVDRWDRRDVMLAADGFRAVVVLALAGVAVGAGAPFGVLAVYLIAFLLASAETFFDPASEAVIATIVRPDRLASANGRLQTSTWLTNIFLGPAIGAFLFGLGAGWPFVADAASFVIAVLIVATLHGSYRATAEASAPPRLRAPLRVEIAEGLRWLARHRLLRSLAIAAGLINLATFGVIAIFVIYARDVLGVSGTAYGALLSAVGLGGLIGATIAPRAIWILGPGGAIRLGLGLGAVAALVMSTAVSVPVVAIASLGFGVMLTFWNVAVITIRQRLVPDELRGRVMSAYRLLSWGSQPIGAVAGGVTASLVSLQAVFVTAAVTYAVMALVSFGILRGRAMPERKSRPEAASTHEMPAVAAAESAST